MEVNGRFIKVDGMKITADDFLQANLLTVRPHPIARIIGFVLNVFWFLFILAALIFYFRDQLFLGWILLPIFLVGVWLVWRYIVFPIRVRKIYEQDSDLNLPCSLETTADGIRTTNETGSHLRRWSDIVKWREDKQLLLLFLSDVKFLMLPKRQITESGLYSSIRDELDEHAIPEYEGRWVGTIIWLGITLLIVAWLGSLFFLIALSWLWPILR